jgi:hypothetical protein
MSSSRTVPKSTDDDAGDPVPPELHAAILRGIADAKAGRSKDGATAVRDLERLVARLRKERDGEAGR